MVSDKLRIACICDASIVQGLGWALDQQKDSGYEFELIPLGLKDIAKVSQDVSMYFINLDLGQPVPIESLRAFDGKPGLIATLHPTPHQLLSVFEVSGLRACVWNGQSFEEIVNKIHELSLLESRNLHRESFMDSLKTWVGTQSTWPSVLKWTNAKTGAECHYYFDEKTPLSIGAAQSGCDICLEIPGSHKCAEFIFFDGSWRFRNLQKDLNFSGDFESNSLYAGDFIEYEHHSFFIKKHPLLDALEHLMIQSHLQIEHDNQSRRPIQQSTLSLHELCKRLMIQRRTGELRVQAEGKYGSIYFIDGTIEDAMSGSAIGSKALFRILSWEQSHWKLNLNQHKEYDGPSLNMELSDFLHKTEVWLKEMQKIAAKSPPPNIRIAIEGKTFYNRPAWNTNEVQVLASLASSEKVFEVLNSCPLEDHLILETLINFRKQNIINVLV